MFVIDEHFWNTLFSPLGGRIASLQTLSRNKLLTNDQQHWLFFRLLYKYFRDKIIRHSVSLHLWLCRTSLGNNDDILQTSFLLQSLWYQVFAGNSSFSYLLMELLKFPFFWELRRKSLWFSLLCGSDHTLSETSLLVFLSLQSFFESHPAPAAERTVQQCCENILLNAAWLKRDADDIQQYLLQRKAPPVWAAAHAASSSPLPPPSSADLPAS